MARNFELPFSGKMFGGDNDAQLVAGDAAATPVTHKGRFAWAFDDTDEEAIVSDEVECPDGYTGSGTLKANILFAMSIAGSNSIALDVFVESKTAGTDTLDMESATSWDSANTGTQTITGTVGNPKLLTVTLSNKDSIASGDFFRIGIRRDCDSASDTATGDLFIYSVTIFEEV